ncbi:MAG: hypothetical protein HYV92_07560 [Candidatus Rokubacteria bacterium]|nr:hypothetical protein [Candidatus Rokubacteria bacterium]
MDCEQVRDRVVTLLQAGGMPPWPEPLVRHLEACQGCREAVEDISRAWVLLGQWPDAEPGAHVRARLLKRVRRELVRESVLTLRGWVPAVLTSAMGVGLSLALSLLVPYSVLVKLCRQALQVSDPHAAPYLLAGMVYGLPLALGIWILRRQALTGALIGSLEASLLFLVILAPYVIAQCREFAPPLQVAFVSGLAGGAVTSSLVGLWLARLVPFGRVHHA